MNVTTKPFCLLITAILFSSCSCTFITQSQKTDPLANTRWEFVDSENSGTDLRILSFSSNGEFMTSAPTSSGERLYNAGDYLILNDSTFVTVHEYQTTANYYNYEISNDTLHFHGHYINPNSEKSMAKMSYIQEWWVKKEKK